MAQPPPGWQVPKPKPPWGYRKTPKGPSPDYTAPAEEHREELRSQKFVVEPLIVKPHEVSDYLPIIYDPLVDVDGVPTTYSYTEEERERSRKAFKELGEEIWFQDPRVKGVVREVTKPIKEYDPKEFSVAWGLKKGIEAEEKLFRDVKSKMEVSVGHTRSKAEKAKLEDKDILAGLLYSKSIALGVGKSAIGITSYFVRPKRIVETPTDIFKFITDPKAQALALQQIVGDPVSAITGVGGTLLGISVVSGITSKVKTKIAEREASKIPSEDFLISDPESRLMEYPSTVTETVTDYILEKTKVSKSGLESPATLMERGKWPKGWGGTPVLLTEDPGLVEIMKPIPFIEVLEGHLPGMAKPKIPIIVGPQPSSLGAIGLLGVLQSEQELVDATMREIVKTEDYLWDRPDYLLEQRQPSKTVETPDTGQLVEPILSTRSGFLPIQEPIQTQRGKSRTVEQELQKELKKDIQDLDRQLRKYDIDMRKTDFKFDRPLTRKEDRRRPKRSLEMWGETRRYPVAERKKFFKKLLRGLL